LREQGVMRGTVHPHFLHTVTNFRHPKTP
jgi:hypothetical protein